MQKFNTFKHFERKKKEIEDLNEWEVGRVQYFNDQKTKSAHYIESLSDYRK